jgi:hypothetical protein
MKFSSNVEFEKYTTAARDARVAAGKMPVGSVIENTTTGTVQWRKDATTWLDIGVPPGASLTPVAYQANPTLASLRDAMVSFGGMSPQPTYQVSGQITGTGNNGVAVALVGAQTYNTTTDGSGNFSFPAVVDGSYTLTANKSGYYFTPFNRSVTVSGANVTAQNFTIAVSAAAGTTTDTHVIVPTSNTGRLRAAVKSGFTLDAATFTNATAQAYTPCVEQSRIFVPNATGIGTVGVWNAATLAYIGSFTAVAGQNVFRLYFSGGKMAIVTSGGIRFGTYNFGTDVFTSGTLLANEVYPIDSDMGNGNIYIASSIGGSPSRNLTVVNIASETVTARTSVISGSTNLVGVQYGAGKLLCIPSTLSSQRIIDAGTFAQFGSDLPINGDPYRMAFAQGHWFQASGAGGVMRWIKVSDGTTGTIASVTAVGCVADDSYVYAADNTNNRLIRIDVATKAVVGSPLTGFASPNFLRS